MSEEDEFYLSWGQLVWWEVRKKSLWKYFQIWLGHHGICFPESEILHKKSRRKSGAKQEKVHQRTLREKKKNIWSNGRWDKRGPCLAWSVSMSGSMVRMQEFCPNVEGRMTGRKALSEKRTNPLGCVEKNAHKFLVRLFSFTFINGRTAFKLPVFVTPISCQAVIEKNRPPHSPNTKTSSWWICFPQRAFFFARKD